VSSDKFLNRKLDVNTMTYGGIPIEEKYELENYIEQVNWDLHNTPYGNGLIILARIWQIKDKHLKSPHSACQDHKQD
jgi:hypothetical protein